MASTVTPQFLARGAAGLAGLTGSAGFLYLMGAFGPVSCGQANRGVAAVRLLRVRGVRLVSIICLAVPVGTPRCFSSGHWFSWVSSFSDTDERHALIDRYFEKLVELADAELFDIAAHPDLIERNPALRGFIDEEHYRKAAAAFERSQTVAEINAGRVFSEYGEFHPAPNFLDILTETNVVMAVGTDSHRPNEIDDRIDRIDDLLDEHGISPAEIP
ncbi:PHP domain-containing protein [Halococcus sediminicola]|uniref:hypothetical protein n=1 Tax=Halococcus sediminicola TaxID=1264579 RepID=UPI0012AB5A83|nr:hypothetical protein [Halococcus sediminicola]